jgi:hypothetical protein
MRESRRPSSTDAHLVRIARFASTVLAAGALAVGPALGASGDATYRGHGVSFRYPSSWYLTHPVGATAQTGTALWTQWLGPTQSLSVDLVIVAAYHTTIAITPATLQRYRPVVATAVRQLAASSRGRVVSGPALIRMGGLPGYRFRMTAIAPDGSPVSSRLVLAWKSHTEYFLNCQHSVIGARRASVEGACDRIAASFRTG